MAGDSITIIDHTEVDDKLEGMNIGYQLVEAAVEFIQKREY